MEKWRRVTSALASSTAGSGRSRNARRGPGSAAGNQVNPKAASSAATGQSPTDRGPGGEERLDQGAAEPLPGRGEHHRVAGRVGVVHGQAGREAPVDRAGGGGQ